MNTHMTERFPDYLMNELDRVQKAEVDSHLQECSLCREEFDTLLRLWARLGTLPEEKPAADLRARFYSMLDAYQEGARQRSVPKGRISAALNEFLQKFWPREPVYQAGVAFALLIAGVFAGARLSSPDQQQSEIHNLRNEVQTIGRLLTISLLNQQSASERLKGVSWTGQFDQADPQIISALVRALLHDPNVNVRLAAVDALDKFVDDPHVQSEMVGALERQQSPLVQIALIDLFVQEGVKQSEDVLKKMVKDPGVNIAVKKRIEEGMQQLSL